ncbi:PcfJ domain-containing protein [Flavobacterium sp. EDS]|uniref:PcfJ domain-containing protein n=1 Tax=Flavobacterium sp. EDS TaxID=2897328 RepID=UPI001E365357|nr:PcfJ domain-containing protein [Flavobacterium sp. EDS]MCD0474011.1 PcfJ domain-containing protein [Flavobacterium sp. EDS]
MIPKSIIEKEISNLSSTLKPITAQMHTWAEKSIFLKWGVLSRGKFHCFECAHSWKPESQSKSCQKFIKCTSCGGKLKIQGCNQVHFREIEYFGVLDVCQDYQVVRIICSHKHMKKNVTPTYSHKEVMQHWINPKGEVRTMSLSTNVFSHAYDAWQYYSSLEIRPKNFQNSPKYQINPYKVYPHMKVLPILKRNGFKTGVYNIAPQILFTALLKDSIAETILKAKQTSLLSYYLQSPHQKILRNWQAVKVCLKNNYIITDYTIWEDYIATLQWFKKDLSCPSFVCPENLNASHDKLVAKKRELQRKKYLIKMRAEIQKVQKVYAEEKKCFFGLCFSHQNLNITVLENVQDFMEEGDILQHCIFTNEYHKKNNSLLFSARIDNIPVETIEVSLSKMEITQCRGIKNNKSKHHKLIMSLMKKNLYQIHSRMKKGKSVKR